MCDTTRTRSEYTHQRGLNICAQSSSSVFLSSAQHGHHTHTRDDSHGRGEGMLTLYPKVFSWHLTPPGSFAPEPTSCCVTQHCKIKRSSNLTSYLAQSPNDGVNIFPTSTGVNLATSVWAPNFCTPGPRYPCCATLY